MLSDVTHIATHLATAAAAAAAAAAAIRRSRCGADPHQFITQIRRASERATTVHLCVGRSADATGTDRRTVRAGDFWHPAAVMLRAGVVCVTGSGYS